MLKDIENIYEPAVWVTEPAVDYVKDWLIQAKTAVGVRLSLKKTGCSGFSYKFDCVDSVNPKDLVRPLVLKYSLYVDRASYEFLKGTIVDLEKNILGKKLIFKNPNVKGQCGCGESFTVKEG
ncbi:MAG: hypothetical protein A3F18_04200 [Legionellales bacterium RIFCSPHIGHO2_12_FULL_37_14]|nr:MAG: hypothetical protein A3F18_04200 [Legionellales bacterium RIFCSPHIGHO2_12_FULL_37_14]